MGNNEDKVFACYLNDLMLTEKLDDPEYSEIGQKWIEKFLMCDAAKSDRLNRNKWALAMLTTLKHLKLNCPVPPPFNCLPPHGPLAQFDNLLTSTPRGCPTRSSPAFSPSGSNRSHPNSSVPPPFNCLPPHDPSAQFDNLSTSSPRGCPTRSSLPSSPSGSSRNPIWQTAETFFSENLHVSFPNETNESGKDEVDLCRVIERLGCDVDVFEFVAAVAPQLEDQGDCLRRALDLELEHFVKNFVQSAHEMANADIGKLMAQKQCEQREKCINWIQRVCHHTKRNLEWVNKVCPGFVWSRYRADREEYLKTILIHKVMEVDNVGHQDQTVDWRRQNILKLLSMRRLDEIKMEEVTALKRALDELQRKMQDIETFMLLGEEMRHEKRAQKLKQLEELMATRDSNKEMVAAMFVALEAGSVRVSNSPPC